MSLRAKLVFAETPLALALAVVGIVSALVIARLGEHTRLILADNYRSVLATQRMEESLERIDKFALLTLAGLDADAPAAIKRHQQSFERELQVQESNITERGERDSTLRLRAAWTDFKRELSLFEQQAPGQRGPVYFSKIQPAFARVKQLADEILAINQDAMVHKSERAERRAHLFEHVVTVGVVLSFAIGLLASAWLTTRMLRPLGVVSAAVRRFGAGDLKARAVVRGKDEIAVVASEFNNMADRLERYRASSLGELLQAQQASQAAIDGLPDPVLLFDAQGRLQGTNAAAGILLGIDLDGVPGEVWSGVDPGVRAVVDRLRAHVLGGKGPYVPRGFEDALRVAPAEGERVFLPRATPIYGETGAVSGGALVFQDATRLFRFDELKNNLVATVAHEFRTPLTSLRMALHLCTEQVVGPLTDKQGDLLFAAREDCERLQVIVDDLLNLSRLESGHIDLHRRRIEAEALVDAAVEVHRAAAEQAQVLVRTEVQPGLPEVFVDPDRLQLVFTNLLSNAIRYSPAGSEILVRAIAERVAADAEYLAPRTSHVRFEVMDHGPGISKEHQAGLFGKFFRVPGSPEGGSGLGLFIAQGLVQAHGGEIGVESAPEKGATFWFRVPVAPAVNAAARSS